MLLKVIDTKGKTRWINAAYVKSLKSKGGVTEIEVAGWNSTVRVAPRDGRGGGGDQSGDDGVRGATRGFGRAGERPGGAQAAVIGVVLGG